MRFRLFRQLHALMGVLILLVSNAAMSQEKLKIINFNVWHGLDAIGLLKFGTLQKPAVIETRLARLLAKLKAEKADVIFLQEMNPVAPLSRAWAKELDMDEIHQADNCGVKIFGWGPPTNFLSGLTILARKDLKLKKVRGKKLSGHWGGFCGDLFSFQLSEFRYALGGEITWQGEKTLLVNTHLHYFIGDQRWEKAITQSGLPPGRIEEIQKIIRRSRKRRVDEVRALTQAMSQWKQEINALSVLFAGDFNAEVETPELKPLRDQYTELGTVQRTRFNQEPFFTYDPVENPFPIYSENLKSYITAKKGEEEKIHKFMMDYHRWRRRIDQIWTNGFEACAPLRKLPPKNEPHLSDHFGLAVEVGHQCQKKEST